MKLLLRRGEKSGMMGGLTFLLDVRAELSDEEKANIKKFKLGDTMLYEREKLKEASSTLGMLGSALAYRMLNLTIRVNDLTGGKRVECKDIVEMLAVEEQIKEACQTFQAVLKAASQFGGEEVIEFK